MVKQITSDEVDVKLLKSLNEFRESITKEMNVGFHSLGEQIKQNEALLKKERVQIIEQALLTHGLASSPEESQQDFYFLRRLRKSLQACYAKAISSLVGALALGVIAALWYGFIYHVKN